MQIDTGHTIRATLLINIMPPSPLILGLGNTNEELDVDFRSGCELAAAAAMRLSSREAGGSDEEVPFMSGPRGLGKDPILLATTIIIYRSVCM